MTPVFGFFYWCLRKDKSPYTNQRGPKRQRSRLFGLLIRTSKKKKEKVHWLECRWSWTGFPIRRMSQGNRIPRRWIDDQTLSTRVGTYVDQRHKDQSELIEVGELCRHKQHVTQGIEKRDTNQCFPIGTAQHVNTFYVQCGVSSRMAYINSDDPIYSCICLLNDYRKVGSCHSDEQSSSISCAKRTRLPIMSLLNLKCCGAQSVWTEPNSKMCRSCHSVWIPQS